MDIEDGVQDDLLQMPLKESWHLGATVEKSEVTVFLNFISGWL